MVKDRSYTRVTLALDIIRKLTAGKYSGFHELGIIKHQIALYDTVTIENSKHLSIQCNNSLVPKGKKNLCWIVVQKLKEMFSIKENVSIYLNKNIPVKGGLAGGSANAASVLGMLNKLWNLNLSKKQLYEIGREIGMDVPYYFLGKTVFDTESTGILKPIDTDIHLDFVLAIPDFGVSTRIAYKNIDYHSIGKDLEKTEVMKLAFKDNLKHIICETVHNDFEYSVYRQYPELIEIKQIMEKAGCPAVVLSGSGSTLLGIAEDKDHASWLCRSIPVRCIQTSTYSA
ncbi:MAG: 4-(cytidine 5'-diphospho)-2-C-methyl-D-erythritol kinase [Chitinispirillia bacterium]